MTTTSKYKLFTQERVYFDVDENGKDPRATFHYVLVGERGAVNLHYRAKTPTQTERFGLNVHYRQPSKWDQKDPMCDWLDGKPCWGHQMFQDYVEENYGAACRNGTARDVFNLLIKEADELFDVKDVPCETCNGNGKVWEKKKGEKE